MSGSRGLKLVSLVPGSGYGNAAAEYLLGLDALGVPVTWTPITDGRWGRGARKAADRYLPEAYEERIEQLRRRRIEYDVLLVDFPPPGWHLRWLRKERRARAFAYAAWEVDRLPPDWAPVLNRFERVLVPSRFNREVFASSGVTVPVDVIPHVARKVEEVSGGERWGQVADDDFVFYTIGTWTTRKALEETVRVYLETFRADESVALIVKTDVVDELAVASMSGRERRRAPKHHGTTWWTLARILRDYRSPAKVHLVAGGMPAREIDRLHTRGDCFLSLSRGEGWGLGPFEAALFGKPSVVTGWGGQLDYLGEDYPLLVDYELEPASWSPRDDYFPDWSARWSRADPRHAGELLRWVFENRERAEEIGADLGQRVRSRFATETVCRQLAEGLGFEIEPASDLGHRGASG